MIRVISETKSPIKIWASDLEVEAELQTKNLASMPFIHKHVALMPDAHAGKGSTVGTVIATKGAIIPAAVGVDIGCGMCAVKLPFQVDRLGGDSDIYSLRHSIERAVPTGRFGNSEMAEPCRIAWNQLGSLSRNADDKISKDIFKRAALQLGSLGGGNHFIEICTDTEGGAWVMLHSGSRNIGKTLADIHINGAKDLMKKYFIDLPDPDLAFLAQDTAEFQDYIQDMNWAQNYAKQNRKEMMRRVVEQIYRAVFASDNWPEHFKNDYVDNNFFVVDCHHNYTTIEHHFGANVFITRKGAVSARAGEYGIIPGSMGAKSFIVKGLGNPDSFHSCSHGAGRRMSRTKARAMFTAKDLELQTEGVNCEKGEAFVDEIPAAYKNIDQVMRDQQDLVVPVYELKQLICVKGSS